MTEGACPSCGAPIRFSAGSARVLVCEHCSTVVARQEDRFEARGRVGALVDTESPFQLGIEGRYQRAPFRIVGRLQKDHGRGPWDEWSLAFDDGRMAWLSEAEGALHLLFAQGTEQGLALSSLEPGNDFLLRGERYVVEERGHSQLRSAQGELPSDVSRTEGSRYVDATGEGGRFASLDFSEGDDAPELFLGQQVELRALGIPPDALVPRARKVKLQAARCPECNGALELQAPDRTLRVGCPYCGALLDASQGKLSFLRLLEKPEIAPLIPLGTRGKLLGSEWICIGFLQRSCTVEGQRYPWTESLLFHPERGFAWLLCSNGHWVSLLPIPAGEVKRSGLEYASYQGRTYRRFQTVQAVTETVLGEFYWEVEAGEAVQASEYVAPPYSLNLDASGDEVSFTHGEYLEPAQVQQAFGLKGPLPRPEGIAPSQPNPGEQGVKEAWRWTWRWAGALLLLFMAAQLFAAKQPVLDERITVAPRAASGSPSVVHFAPPFDIPRTANLKAELLSPEGAGDWGVQAELVRQDTGEVTSFYLERSALDEDEVTAYLGRVPAGRYSLKTTAVFDAPQPGARAYQLRLVSDTPRLSHFIWGLVLLLLLPLFQVFRKSQFETQRWVDR